jgi:hypothetical protein
MVTQNFVNVGPLIFGGIFGILGLLSLFPLAFVIVVVANRAEPDASGRRPFSVYMFGMSFVTLLFAYGGLTMIVTSLLSFIGPHPQPIANGVAQTVVIGALVLIIAGGTLHKHFSQGLAAARSDGRVDGPNARILHTFISAVSFIFVVVAIVSLGLAAYMVFQLIGPGVFGSTGGTSHTVQILLDLVYLMISSGILITRYQRHAPVGLLRGSATSA